MLLVTNMVVEIQRRLKARVDGSMLPFAVVDNTLGKAVGMASCMHIDAPNRRVEIGVMSYRKSVQRSDLSTQSNLLLSTHAFDALGCAMEFRAHCFNHQIRIAHLTWQLARQRDH